jgi:glucose-1-phosphate thymidylyltransferase
MDKVVLLAAGRGSRMRREQPATELTIQQREVARLGLKAMMPVGRPLIDYVLSGLADVGFRHVCLVIGPNHGLLEQHCRGYKAARLNIEFAVQQNPKGTADALIAAQDFVGDDQFLLLNADNLYPAVALSRLRGFNGSAVAAFTRDALCRGNISPDRLQNFALLSLESDDLLARVCEKPTPEQLLNAGTSPLINMNCWRFTPAILDACRSIGPSIRGEYELTDAVNHAIHQLGEHINVTIVEKPVLDLSTRADVAEVSRRLLGIEVNL